MRGAERASPSRAGALELPPTECAARDALFQEFQPLVRRLLRQYGETPEIREELAGELYCRFAELLREFDPSRGVPLRAFLVRALTGAAYTFARSHWRRQRREVRLEPEPGAEPDLPVADPTGDWDRRLLIEEMLERLPSLIERLPKRQRQVLVWRYYESRSFEEIAGLLEVQVGTARSLLRHGLNHLRRQFAEME